MQTYLFHKARSDQCPTISLAFTWLIEFSHQRPGEILCWRNCLVPSWLLWPRCPTDRSDRKLQGSCFRSDWRLPVQLEQSNERCDEGADIDCHNLHSLRIRCRSIRYEFRPRNIKMEYAGTIFTLWISVSAWNHGYCCVWDAFFLQKKRMDRN